jgi:hypothetical protein
MIAAMNFMDVMSPPGKEIYLAMISHVKSVTLMQRVASLSPEKRKIVDVNET